MSRLGNSAPQPQPGARSGLVQGGLGGAPDELIEDGQEEVFSRSEVELGAVEHHSDTDGHDALSDGS